jgi:predicted transcriptional regulator
MEERPLVVELLTHTLNDLSDAGSNFRRIEARELYSEGLTMAKIAELFGVSRQRIAALLRPGTDPTGNSSRHHRLRDVNGLVALICSATADMPL